MMYLRHILLVFLAACAVPQEIEEAGPDGPTGDQAPRIVSRAPAGDRIDTGCNSYTFELQVIEDFDEEDDLEVRWFVDYDYDEASKEPFESRVIPGGAGVNNGVRSPPGDSFRLEEQDLRSDTAVVTAVVSDGFADPETAPLWQAVRPGRDSDRATWTIHFRDDGICEE